jgi:hypothetical protein
MDNMDNEKVSKVSENFCCEMCGYISSHKSNYKKHLVTDKHKNAKMDNKSSKMDNTKVAKSEIGYKCGCGNNYKYKTGLSKHKKKCNFMTNDEKIEKLNNIVLEQQKQIDELKMKPTTIINNTNNIQINAFGKENTEYLSSNPKYKQMMTNCLQEKEQGIMKLIDIIYFNNEHPENQNIRISNKKDNLIKCFDGSKWKLLIANDGIVQLLNRIETEFSNFLEQMEDEGERVKDPIMKRFMQNIGHPLDFDFSHLQYEYDTISNEKELEKIKKNLYTLFIFFVNEKTKELLNKSSL